MSEVGRIHEGKKLPKVFPVSLEQLGQWLAEAEVMGGMRALAGQDDVDKVIWWSEARATEATRAHLWEARIRGELEARK